MIEFTDQPIDSNAVLASVSTPAAGANVLFLGTTRQFTGEVETVELNYEGYESMVLKELKDIRETAMQRWPIEKCTIVHRYGTVKLAEASVAVAVSTPHRADSFAAAEWILETLKQRAPIWKRDLRPDGYTEWVEGNPVDF
jgi:molybdopterin synthase catalytic subunit